MKKFLSFFLILGFVVLGMTTSCKASVDSPEKKKDNTEETQTSSTTTTTQTQQEPQLIVGTPVTSSDGILTVTPRSDGLLIQASFTEPWQHITFCIQKNIQNEWHVATENDCEITTANGQSTCSLLYPFTEKDMTYKIWFVHMGNADDEWTDWTSSENDDPVFVTGLGGLGNMEAMSGDGQYLSPRRGFYMKNLYVDKPQVSLQEKLVFRAECGGTRWGPGEKYFETQTVSDTVWFPDDEDDELNQYLKGQDKIFITIY